MFRKSYISIKFDMGNHQIDGNWDVDLQKGSTRDGCNDICKMRIMRQRRKFPL
jgi:hypothetical protein